jgi:hypothetical protein
VTPHELSEFFGCPMIARDMYRLVAPSEMSETARVFAGAIRMVPSRREKKRPALRTRGTRARPQVRRVEMRNARRVWNFICRE